MAILPIRLLPDPILRKKARRVNDIEPAIQKLAADMIETMQAGNGAGLAAPQVGILRRLITIQTPDLEPFALINPEIAESTGERRIREGCLSVPGWFGMVTRAVTISAIALDTDGGQVEISNATEILAQALEHEIDHLNGIVFTDHLQAHMDLWKLGEEPEIHSHDEIDFDHEAAHGHIWQEEDKDDLFSEAPGGVTDDVSDPERDDELEDDQEKDPEPPVYEEMAVYKTADFGLLERTLREMSAQLSDE